jgi:hypothetical protein
MAVFDGQARKEWSNAIRALPSFDARTTGQGTTWRNHRREIEQWFLLFSINEIGVPLDRQKLAICSTLKGNADRAVQLHGPGKPSFNAALTVEAYLDVIEAVFQPQAETALARQDFVAREQTTMEPVSVYLADKFALYYASIPNEAQRNFRDLKEHALKGLRSKYVQNKVIEKEPESEEQLMAVCATAVGQARQGYTLGTGIVPNLDGLASTTLSNRFLMNQDEPMEVDRMGEDRSCYKCNKKGHLAKDCHKDSPRGRGGPTQRGGHGGPSGRGRGRDGPARSKTDLVCYYCANKGHKRPECRSLKKDKQDGKVHPDKVAKKQPNKTATRRIPGEDEDPTVFSDADDDDFGNVNAIDMESDDEPDTSLYRPEDWEQEGEGARSTRVLCREHHAQLVGKHPDDPDFWDVAGLRLRARKAPPKK